MRIELIDPLRVPLAGWSPERASSTGFDVTPESLAGVFQKLQPDRPKVPFEERGRRPPPGRDPDNPAIGRWAVVVRAADEAAAREHLAPLLRHRAAQKVATPSVAGRPPGLVVVRGPTPTSNDTWRMQISAAASGRAPRYLLLVGGPDRFPFDLQLHLDLWHHTGRLDLGLVRGELDWPAAGRWAERLVALETGSLTLSRSAIVFAPASDEATALSLEGLATPALAALQDASRWGESPPEPIALLDSNARRDALVHACESARPRLVLTASHGVEFPADPSLWGALTDTTFRPGSSSDQAFSASIVPGRPALTETARPALSAAPTGSLEGASLAPSVALTGSLEGASLTPPEAGTGPGQTTSLPFAEGSIFVAFACHSAGVPAKNPYRSFLPGVPESYPDAPFVSPLPRALLACPRGPVAFIGHVGAATALSFYAENNPDPAAFLDLLDWALPATGTLGQAMSTFFDRSLAASDRVANLLDPARATRPDPQTLLRAWVAHHDLRGYILLGDPATVSPVP